MTIRPFDLIRCKCRIITLRKRFITIVLLNVLLSIQTNIAICLYGTWTLKFCPLRVSFDLFYSDVTLKLTLFTQLIVFRWLQLQSYDTAKGHELKMEISSVLTSLHAWLFKISFGLDQLFAYCHNNKNAEVDSENRYSARSSS